MTHSGGPATRDGQVKTVRQAVTQLLVPHSRLRTEPPKEQFKWKKLVPVAVSHDDPAKSVRLNPAPVINDLELEQHTLTITNLSILPSLGDLECMYE